jgi:DNA-binding winged helix-turn-helix (wHTH) protein/tetratricopeptide (TPR) repeat protein
MNVPKPELQLEPEVVQYTFGRYCLCPDGTLLRDSAVVSLPPKEAQILRLLLAGAGQIIPAQKLREKAWGEVHVSADSLPRCVSSLRARLDSADCIQTVYKRGYRFTLPVQQNPTGRVGERVTERRAARFSSVPRLAIVPFQTKDGVPDYFGPGIAEQTMLRLGRARNGVVEVMAQNSVFTLVEGGASSLAVAKELRADLALTGTVTALATHFRLRAELTRVASTGQLWVEDFLVPRESLAYADTLLAKRIIARIRDSFARPVVPHGSVSLSAAAPREAQRSQAYALYMQACVQWNTMERHQMQDAIRGFHQAIDLDESLFPARLHLMHAYLGHSTLGYMRADLAAELARKQAEIIHAQASSSYSVHPALGWIHFHHDRDFAAAAAAFARPQGAGYSPWNLIYQVRFALGQGRAPEAIALLRSALEADPYSPALHGRLAWALHLAGDARGALERAKRAHSLFPNHAWIMLFCSIVYAAAGNAGRDENGQWAAQATELALRLTQSSPSLDAGYATLAYVQARQGRIIEARALLDRQQWLSRERFVMRSFQAPALVELGEIDAAIEALVTADEQHCPWLFELLGDPRLKPLHGEPEFERLRAFSRKDPPADASVA